MLFKINFGQQTKLIAEFMFSLSGQLSDQNEKCNGKLTSELPGSSLILSNSPCCGAIALAYSSSKGSFLILIFVAKEFPSSCPIDSLLENR